MSRLFQTLVVAGAALSATACAGKSSRTLDDADDAGNGGTVGGSSGSSGTNGGTDTGGTGPTSGGTGPSGGTPATGGTFGGTAGSSGVGGLPDPGPTAQWNCMGLVGGNDCVEVVGTTAARIPSSCPVEPERPRTAADCAAGEMFTCILAVTPSSELVLVNCQCDPPDWATCGSCTNLQSYHGAPAYCDGVRKVCACAYTGILL